MWTPQPRLTEARRAGLLAAVAVYPLGRLEGTLPRPPLDRALVSGTTMAIAFRAAALTTTVLDRISGIADPSPRRRALRTATAAVALTATATGIAIRARARAREAATTGHRLPVPAATTGAVAEVLAVAAAAGALVATADTIGMGLPERLHPAHPAVVAAGVILAGAGLGAVAGHPRLLEHLTLPVPEGTPDAPPRFRDGARLPDAVARSVLVAAMTVAGLTLETHAAEGLARVLGAEPHPGTLAVLAGHSVIAGGFALAGVAGFGFYSSRVALKESVLEAAYAAVPARRGLTGGEDSAYAFASLGREGRRFVSQAHTAEELSGVLGTPAADPVRAWIPLAELTREHERDCAALVAEIERLGGFAKGTIVLAAPVGDGYVSYVHTESVEMLTAGDCTTVAVPYAALPSLLAMPGRARASAEFAAYARAIAERAHALNPDARLFTFGESLGSIVALDAFGPDLADELGRLGFSGGLYCGVPIFSRTDRVLRPTDPSTREHEGLQYATGREQALAAGPGHLNVTHPTDPLAVADFSTMVRHGLDYWGRPFGVHIPVVSFLVHLMDVKNAMNLRPGQFNPSLGHDYRYDTAAAVATAYGLPFDRPDVIETALRERELAWSVRRLLGRRFGDARESILVQLVSWGVDPDTLSIRFRIPASYLPAWMSPNGSADVPDPEHRDPRDLPAV